MRSTRRVSTRITSPDKDSSTVSVPHQFPAIPAAKQPGMVDDFDLSRFVEVRRRPILHFHDRLRAPALTPRHPPRNLKISESPRDFGTVRRAPARPRLRAPRPPLCSGRPAAAAPSKHPSGRPARAMRCPACG